MVKERYLRLDVLAGFDGCGAHDRYEKLLRSVYGYDESHYRFGPNPAHGGNTISSGMAAGTICDGDADCSDATGADSAPTAADDDDGGDPDPEPARQRPSNTHPQAIAPSPARASERGTATATAGNPSHRIDPESELWRLPAVLAHVPISRSSWFAGVRSGRYPKPVRLSERRVACKRPVTAS